MTIVHDKDVGKQPHLHAMIALDATLTYNEIKDIIKNAGYDSNVFVQTCKDPEASEDYLTHKNDPAKAQYDEQDIVKVNPSVIQDAIELKRNTLEIDELVTYLTSPQFSVITAARKYGRDFIKNIKSYMHFRELALHELHERDRLIAELEAAERAKRAAERAAAEAIELRYQSVIKYCIERWSEEPTADQIGTYTRDDYERLYDWVRIFVRDRKVRTIPVYRLVHLPTTAFKSITNLIHKRMNDGITYRFIDEEPDVFEELARAARGYKDDTPYCMRYDILNPSSEYNFTN